MPKHTTTIKGWNGSLEELANEICNMRYDAVSDFVGYMRNEFERQAASDRSKGRKKLSSKLFGAVIKLNETMILFYDAWDICKPHMEEL